MDKYLDQVKLMWPAPDGKTAVASLEPDAYEFFSRQVKEVGHDWKWALVLTLEAFPRSALSLTSRSKAEVAEDFKKQGGEYLHQTHDEWLASEEDTDESEA